MHPSPNISSASLRPPPFATHLGITESGLVLGRSVLVRFNKSIDRVHPRWGEADEGRLVALLSVAEGHPVSSARVEAQIAAAKAYWQRGEKALANLRLAFADLPKLDDHANADRVALAEHLLDAGLSPNALMAELWPSRNLKEVEKYNSAHVPAGHGRRSGQFDFKSGASGTSDGRIVVAGGDDDKTFKERELLGETTAKDELEHGRPITPSTGIPILGGQGGATGGLRTVDTLSAMARVAVDKVGPGKGPLYGTAVHNELKGQIKALKRDDLHSEQSYLNRERVDYGTPGSVRPDAVQGAKDQPNAACDLKTGSARLSPSRVRQFQSHLPLREDGTEVPVYEFRP